MTTLQKSETVPLNWKGHHKLPLLFSDEPSSLVFLVLFGFVLPSFKVRKSHQFLKELFKCRQIPAKCRKSLLALVMFQRMHDYRKFFVGLKFGVPNIWAQYLPTHNAPGTVFGEPML